VKGKKGWEFLTGHSNGNMPLKTARERYIK
jgi:hypothetical protein